MKKLIALVSFISLNAMASERTVYIPTSNSSFELVNSSPVPVTYSINCPDKVTQANVISSPTGRVIPAKQSEKISPGGTGCANGATASHTTAEGVVFCSKSSTDYSSAASLCAGQLCTFQKLNELAVTSFLSGIPSEHWMDTGSTGNWSTCDMGGCDQDNTYAPVADPGTSNHCTSQGASLGVQGPSCHSHMKTDTMGMGAVCCPTNNGTATCEIKIESSTPQNGFLQSPSFKGGSPF